MTEAEWIACTDPAKMLTVLQSGGRITNRKLRLFGAACCRRIWHLLPDQRSRRAVEVGELLADGLVTEAEAEETGNAAAEVTGDDTQAIPEDVRWRAARAAEYLLPLPEEAWQLQSAWEYVATAMEGEQLVKEGSTPEALDAWSEQSVESGRTMGWTAIRPDAILAEVLREVAGPVPFRGVAIDPAILAWNDRTVRRLVLAIYDGRQFEDMPILHDALFDAGCHNQDLINHCNAPGPHVRGCWVLDLLLGKG